MAELIFSIFTVILVVYGQGIIFNEYLFKSEITAETFFQTFFFGFIFLGFNILIINFFLPINKYVGTLILFFSIFFVLIKIISSKKKIKILKKFIILTTITFFLIAFSNVNRPDAGLYHLPYLSILHENKVIIGLTNLHFRFGHISIIQYISSAFNNFIIPLQSLSIPAALIFSSFIYFLFSMFKKKINSNDNINTLIFFLLIIISIYSFNRFSEYGNDKPAHIYLLLLYVYIVVKQNNKEYFPNIVLISTFLFLMKPFMIIVGLLVIYLFINQKKKLNFFFNTKIQFSIFFLILWLIKNLLVSGCLIYPISSLCNKNLIITDIEKTTHEEISGEAWSKDWINYKDKIYNIEDYNKKFRWIKTWYHHHFKIILEKFSPILVFLFLTYFVLSLNRQNIRKKNISNNNNFLVFFFFLLVAIWFVKFPLYRFGSSFLTLFFVSLIILLTKNFEYSTKVKYIRNFFNIFLIISIIGFLGKNSLRILRNINSDNYFPQIYSFTNHAQNKQKEFKMIALNKKGHYFFSNGDLCMYSDSPCTHIKLNNIVFDTIYNYKIFYKKK